MRAGRTRDHSLSPSCWGGATSAGRPFSSRPKRNAPETLRWHHWERVRVEEGEKREPQPFSLFACQFPRERERSECTHPQSPPELLPKFLLCII